jgi:hypothetical protein
MDMRSLGTYLYRRREALDSTTVRSEVVNEALYLGLLFTSLMLAINEDPMWFGFSVVYATRALLRSFSLGAYKEAFYDLALIREEWPDQLQDQAAAVDEVIEHLSQFDDPSPKNRRLRRLADDQIPLAQRYSKARWGEKEAIAKEACTSTHNMALWVRRGIAHGQIPPKTDTKTDTV